MSVIFIILKETAPPVGRAEDMQELLILLLFFFRHIHCLAAVITLGLVLGGVDGVDEVFGQGVIPLALVVLVDQNDLDFSLCLFTFALFEGSGNPVNLVDEVASVVVGLDEVVTGVDGNECVFCAG